MAEPHERECAVCTNDFTTPKILPCGHLLCRECVITWMDSKPAGGCPLCRCPIVEQSDGSSSATVDALPTDFVMEALVESARVLSKDHLCCVCEDVRADFICMQCQDMLCTACTKAHRKLSATRSHDVESVSTVTPERLAASRPALCANHGDKQADSFCFYHQLVVCKSCKFQKHRECPKVSDFDHEIHSTENSLRDLTKILVEAEQKLEQAIGQLTSCLQEVDVSEQEDMAHVDTTCDRLQKLVEEFRKKLKEKTSTSHLQIRNSLRDVKTDLSNRLGKVTSHKHIVTRVTALSPRPALIHMRQSLTDRVNSLDYSSDLEGEVWVKPSSSKEWCLEAVRRIENELLRLEQLKAETKTFLPSCSLQLNEAMKESQISRKASGNITSLEDTKEVAKETALDCYSENETSSGLDAFDSKRRSGNFAALGPTNNNTEEVPGFINERGDFLQRVILRQNVADLSTPVDDVVPAPTERNVTKGNKSDSVVAEKKLIADPIDESPAASLEHTQEYSLSDIDNLENLDKTTSDKDLGVGQVRSESEVNLHTQRNTKDSFYKPSDMGECFPSSHESSSCRKPRKNINEENKKERGRNASRQLPESHRWSDHDLKVYREGYTNKKDNPKSNHNLKFYQGTMSSLPDGDFIDNIHKKWWGDYDLLERHTGYIQWLFPIRESGKNRHAQELQMHEAKAIQRDERASERFLKSYEMMLDFYGMKLVDGNNGQVQRSEKWKERFHHLNHSTHNYLRITRILKCLGEMGLEHFKKPLIRFILNEAIYKGTLDRTLDTCLNYWVGTLRKDEDRQEMEEYTKQLFHKKDNHMWL